MTVTQVDLMWALTAGMAGVLLLGWDPACPHAFYVMYCGACARAAFSRTLLIGALLTLSAYCLIEALFWREMEAWVARWM
jgi:uncharacterized membrane protein YqaE (UPF0057 family)